MRERQDAGRASQTLLFTHGQNPSLKDALPRASPGALQRMQRKKEKRAGPPRCLAGSCASPWRPGTQLPPRGQPGAGTQHPPLQLTRSPMPLSMLSKAWEKRHQTRLVQAGAGAAEGSSAVTRLILQQAFNVFLSKSIYSARKNSPWTFPCLPRLLVLLHFPDGLIWVTR